MKMEINLGPYTVLVSIHGNDYNVVCVFDNESGDDIDCSLTEYDHKCIAESIAEEHRRWTEMEVDRQVDHILGK